MDREVQPPLLKALLKCAGQASLSKLSSSHMGMTFFIYVLYGLCVHYLQGQFGLPGIPRYHQEGLKNV